MDLLEYPSSVIRELWMRLYNWCGQDDFWCHIAVNVIFTYSLFWAGAIFYGILDLTGRPTFLTKYKVQQQSPLPVSIKQYIMVFKRVAFNHIFIAVPLNIVCYPVFQYMGVTGSPDKLPSLPVFVRDYIVFSIVEEMSSYYTHRLLHVGSLYRYAHKIHHENTAPVAMAAHYGHPVDFFTNLMGLSLGPLFMGSHFIMAMLWNYIAITGTVIGHSGYHFPGCASPQFHDYHHYKFNTNFGGGFLDWFHDTIGHYEGSIHQKRDRRFYSLTPIHEIYPDPKENGKKE